MLAPDADQAEKKIEFIRRLGWLGLPGGDEGAVCLPRPTKTRFLIWTVFCV